LRVIAGIYGRRTLRTLRGQALRPSSDQLRETLFNIIGPSVEDSYFLDLFAGSGAVGIEALSRGARRAIFVENHSAGGALLRRNLRSLGIAVTEGSRRIGHATEFSGGAEILLMDAVAALELLSARGTRGDFVFADPPYGDDAAYERVLAALGELELLASGGQAIFEHSRRRTLPAVSGRLERMRVRERGDSALSFYRVVQAA
jgi:16S rRNA (guanine(966)-N(2))-methyltransferase RsmD